MGKRTSPKRIKKKTLEKKKKWYKVEQAYYTRNRFESDSIIGFIRLENWGTVILERAHINKEHIKIVKKKLKKSKRINECMLQTHEVHCYVSHHFVSQAARILNIKNLQRIYIREDLIYLDDGKFVCCNNIF